MAKIKSVEEKVGLISPEELNDLRPPTQPGLIPAPAIISSTRAREETERNLLELQDILNISKQKLKEGRT